MLEAGELVNLAMVLCSVAFVDAWCCVVFGCVAFPLCVDTFPWAVSEPTVPFKLCVRVESHISYR